jgi:hypothetical protein
MLATQINLKMCSFAAYLLMIALAGTELSAQPAASPSRIHVAGVQISVHEQTLLITLPTDFEGKTIELPRLAAPLRSLHWKGQSEGTALKLQPELQTWKISWENRPENVSSIEMELDAPPALMSEISPIAAAGDGSLFLPAHMARTSGSKIRYEPQTFKNTVGYWAGMDNTAAWQLEIATPGKFNVSILQGCGAGQGGSTAEITVHGPAASEGSALEFEVQETGHFQNFIWRHLGTIEIKSSGEHTLQIAPKSIQRGALMDVRAVHLVRLP